MGRTYQSILIQAPVDRVWQAVRDFHDLSWAPDVVESGHDIYVSLLNDMKKSPE